MIDETGNPIASNLAALVIAPGPVLSGQDRSSGQITYPQCGGNYDARNYLDTPNMNNAVLGVVNYYAGSKNNGVAPDANNKTFVMTSNANYNDRFAFITVDDIFNRIMLRKDFASQIDNLFNWNDSSTNPVTSLSNIQVSGFMGTDNMKCSSTDFFCQNWKEMLLLKDYVNPVPVMLDNNSIKCTRVVIFGGKKTNNQIRVTSSQKSNPANYLEPVNVQGFNQPPPQNPVQPVLAGISKFDPKQPEADVIKCLN